MAGSNNLQILTWNINGIRASKKKLKDLFDELDADIICLQETKVTRDQLDEACAIVDGYNSYFSFSRTKSGYSGVATFVRNSATPVKAEEGLTGQRAGEGGVGCYGDLTHFTDEELTALDAEGRAVITQHKFVAEDGEEKLVTVINVYCPRADPDNDDRLTFKMKFYNLVQSRAEAILESGSHVIVLGDVNTSHKEIDHCDPSEIKEFQKNPGRIWLDQFLYDPQGSITEKTLTDGMVSHSGHRFVDTFRRFHPTRTHAFTCWSTVTGARATNYGTRIDYILADVDLTEEAILDCDILPDVQGSDHCPVKASLKWKSLPADKCPAMCTKYLPEFTGKQQKLSSFFSTRDPKEQSCINSLNFTTNKQQTDSNKSDSQEQTDKPPALKRGRSDPDMKQNSGKKTKLTSNSSQKTLKTFFTSQAKQKTLNQCSIPEKDSYSDSSTKDIQLNVDKQTDSLCKDSTAKDSQLNTDNHTARSSVRPASSAWSSLLSGPPPAPLCTGHQEAAVLRTVKKDSDNKGRQFWVCNRPAGHKTNPDARCDFFVWVDKKKTR